ncbi:MAG TPA: GNAT family N-acetyltransferase [Ktedonobacterales bacterium]|nr:GNAT family N-acetyltransferase [Ktedonobacterales bacterium]
MSDDIENDVENAVVRNNEAEQRYELEVDGHLAVIEYERGPERVLIMHTEVPAELEGHGVAGKMARFALEDARAQHLAVVPLCPYVAGYIRQHQEYADLVSPGHRSNMKPE